MVKGKTFMTVALFLFFVVIVSVLINVFLLNTNVVISKDIYLNGDKVIISKNAEEQLRNIYTVDLATEVPVCLAGEITKESIRIDGVERAQLVSSTASNATYIQCPVYISSYKAIGTMHNHPSGICKLSGQDMKTYSSDIRRGQEIIGLSCEDGYVFYILSYMESEVETW